MGNNTSDSNSRNIDKADQQREEGTTRDDVLELAALAAHQLRSPLSSVHSVLSTVAGGFLGPVDPRQREFLEKALQGCSRSMKLVADLLRLRSLDDLEAGDLSPVDPRVAFDSAVGRIRDEASAKDQDLRIEMTLHDPAAGWVIGESAVLEEAMLVLLDNAVKYTPSGGQVSATLEVLEHNQDTEEDGRLQLRVEDTGIGIPPEAMAGLFREFYRAPNAKAASRSGTGLGLSFAARVAHLLGGKVEISSTTSGGVDARLILPAIRQEGLVDRESQLADVDLDEESRRIVIIGGVTAGSKVAAKLMRLDPEARITIVEKSRAASYAGCGMPYYVSGVVRDQRDLITTALGEERDSALFHDVKNLETLELSEATKIDPTKRQVKVRSLTDGSVKTLNYDTLVLATGSYPKMPGIPGTDKRGVYTFQGAEDAEAIRRELAETSAKEVVIIGAGLLGCEITESLSLTGARVSLFEQNETVLGILDPELAVPVQRHLKARGVRVSTGTAVREIEGDQRVESVLLDSGGRLPCDLVIVATGFEPEVRLAVDAGLELGSTGAIRVDETLRTSDPSILAIGDCAEKTNLVTGKPAWIPMGSTALKEGRVAALNICGRHECFPGIVGSTVIKIFDLTVAKTGLGEADAEAAGFDPVVALAPSLDCAHYLPTAKPILIKLIADRASGRVLGSQGVGEGLVDKRIDTAAAAIALGADIDRLSLLDLPYAPPYGLGIDSLLVAANIIRNKIDGTLTGISSRQLLCRQESDDTPVIIDVRLPRAFREFHMDGSLNIPLGSLRGRVHQVPRDREVVIVSRTGLKSYEAFLILKNQGFDRVSILDGGLEGWPYELTRF